MKKSKSITPPQAKKIRKTITKHGDRRTDNYDWLRHGKTSDIKKYLKQENTYTDNWFADTTKIRKELFSEMKGRIREADSSVPYQYNRYWYGSDVVAKKEYRVNWRRKGTRGSKQVLLDQNRLARGHDYFSVGGIAVSPDNTTLAYATDVVANKRYTLYIKNIESGTVSKRTIPEMSGNVVWATDSVTLLYTVFDETQRPYRVWAWNTQTNKKELVFEETNGLYWIGVGKTTNGEYIMISGDSHDGNMTYIVPSDLSQLPRKLHGHTKDKHSGYDYADEVWYQITNRNHPDSEILSSSNPKAPLSQWKRVYRPGVGKRVRDFTLSKHGILISEMKQGIGTILIIPQKGPRYYIDADEEVFDAGLYGRTDYYSDSFMYVYESMVTPDSVIEHNLMSHKNTTKKVLKPVGRYNIGDYETKRIWARSEDGQKIPMSMVYKKSLMKKDGTNPCLQFGYGSYGYSVAPQFNVNILSLLDRGFIHVIAHIRGGREMGEAWYQDGKYLKKKNTFSDFVDCSRHLIKHGYTSTDGLFARGGSAGGLLMGAVANLAPELYRGMIVQVPFVDSLNTMLDESIPLTVGEYVEWGNPNNKRYYNYMKSYAPYEQIEKKAYPAMLVTAGFNDTQVHYWESAKYVAKLREYKKDDNPLLLHMDMGTGHGGKSGRYQYLDEVAMIYAFMLKMLENSSK